LFSKLNLTVRLEIKRTVFYIILESLANVLFCWEVSNVDRDISQILWCRFDAVPLVIWVDFMRETCRAYTCPLCGASGDNAHTMGYCPQRQGSTPPRRHCRIASKRLASGKLRSDWCVPPTRLCLPSYSNEDLFQSSPFRARSLHSTWSISKWGFQLSWFESTSREYFRDFHLIRSFCIILILHPTYISMYQRPVWFWYTTLFSLLSCRLDYCHIYLGSKHHIKWMSNWGRRGNGVIFCKNWFISCKIFFNQ